MKIGIISHYRALILDGNYGTLFQNWALQSYLNHRGHETTWVRTKYYSSRKKRKSTLSRNIKALLVRYGFGAPRISPSPHKRPYQAFFRKYVPFSEYEYYADDLQRNPPKVDAFLVGSDQVWNSPSPLMFLEFAPAGTLRVAYAASANWKRLPATWPEDFSAPLSRLDAVSVRENEGLELCKKAGRSDTQHVLDPALLPKKQDYLQLVQLEGDDIPAPKPFVFSYFVGFDEAYSAPLPKLRDVAKNAQLDLQIDIVQQHGGSLPAGISPTVNPTPTQWLNAFNSSRFVVTNSFHGMVFSIIFKTPFLVVLRNASENRGNERMMNVLTALNLQQRAITLEAFENKSYDEIQSLLEAEIQWESVTLRLDKLRSKSKAFLDSALGVPKPA